MKKYRNSGDLRRVFEELMFKSIKSWDLKINLDEIHHRYLPLVLEYVFEESIGTKSIQLYSMYCSPLDLFKKFQKDVSDSELIKIDVELDDLNAKCGTHKHVWNPTSKNP